MKKKVLKFKLIPPSFWRHQRITEVIRISGIKSWKQEQCIDANMTFFTGGPLKPFSDR